MQDIEGTIEGNRLFIWAVGCRECRFDGYKGRVGIYEMFEMDPQIREATYRRSSTLQIRDQARLTGGLRSLREDGLRKVLEGVTSLDEVLRVAGAVMSVDAGAE